MGATEQGACCSTCSPPVPGWVDLQTTARGFYKLSPLNGLESVQWQGSP